MLFSKKFWNFISLILLAFCFFVFLTFTLPTMLNLPTLLHNKIMLKYLDSICEGIEIYFLIVAFFNLQRKNQLSLYVCTYSIVSLVLTIKTENPLFFDLKKVDYNVIPWLLTVFYIVYCQTKGD